ncbi:MAG: nucleoside triphosphate pyrophosphohydrolase [Desulfomonile sp.]|nr:nucleoside triphosphate pyrophosphohydrolase [Desulfomonile sp.]
MSPPASSANPARAFVRLVELIETLRSDSGCPWDRKQTPMSFHHYILEEYHELVQAMSENDAEAIADEMGDLLFLVVFVAYMLQQQGGATLEAVIDGVVEKMTRRHPHVFGDAVAKDPEQVMDNWAKIKAAEENIRRRDSLLEGIPRSLPAIKRAQKLARRAARVGFDWSGPEDVLAKIDEELRELKASVSSGSRTHIREEIGDLFFVVANVARHLEIDGETALNETSDKFERRFRYIERALADAGKSFQGTDPAEMDRLWDEAKAQEKDAGGEGR